MQQILGATQILKNIGELMGYSTKRQLAEFFGVGPSAVTDWQNRKGDRIPERRLAYVARLHGLRWQWLAYGDGPPYERQHVEQSSGIELAPRELELLGKLKGSALFRRAVERLLGLDDSHIKLICQVAESMGPRKAPEPVKTDRNMAYSRWSSGLHLTSGR
jgi:hypothetical protein